MIQIENSVRHLAHDGGTRSRIDVVRDAAIEVRKPTMFGELIIMIVYMPILTLEGIEGKLFRPMALTVIFALVGSLVLSLTLMPVLASLLLPKTPRERDPIVVRAAKRLYAPVLDLVLRLRAVILIAVVIALVGGVFLATRLGTVFIPRLSEEALVINTVRLAGVSVDESVRYGTQIERLLLEKFPNEILHVWSRTGTAEVATDPMGLELTDVFLTLKPRDQWVRANSQGELVELMEAELAGMPAMRTIFTQPIEMRVNEMVAGIRSDLGIKLFGDDFDTLKSLGDRIAAIVGSVPGAGDVTVEQVTGQPLLEVRVRQEQLARYGLAAGDVLDFVASIGDVQVGEIRQGQVRFPLTVRLPDAYRTDPESVGNLLIPSASGERLPLYRLADLRITSAPAPIAITACRPPARRSDISGQRNSRRIRAAAHARVQSLHDLPGQAARAARLVGSGHGTRRHDWHRGVHRGRGREPAGQERPKPPDHIGPSRRKSLPHADTGCH